MLNDGYCGGGESSTEGHSTEKAIPANKGVEDSSGEMKRDESNDESRDQVMNATDRKHPEVRWDTRMRAHDQRENAGLQSHRQATQCHRDHDQVQTSVRETSQSIQYGRAGRGRRRMERGAPRDEAQHHEPKNDESACHMRSQGFRLHRIGVRQRCHLE